MRVEVAVVKMVEAARQRDIAPERLAKVFELALEKVASMTPAGEAALKIVQTNLIKELLKSELNVVARLSKGPRAPRRSKAEVEDDNETTLEQEIFEAFHRELPARRGRPRKVVDA